MIISVASGKGGTGKTLVAANLALSMADSQILDCDVEAPNVHFFVRQQVDKIRTVEVLVPEVDPAVCRFCGRCQAVCEFHAISIIREQVLFFPQLCHSCGACVLLCPSEALREQKREIGKVETGAGDEPAFVRGSINVGESLAPPVIREVRREGLSGRTVIIDCPPGTSCPALTAVRGSDFCLLVTEPTPFGLHDVRLAVEMVRNLDIPFGIIINRAGMGDDRVEQYCAHEEIPVLMRIPFSKSIARACAQGIPLVEACPEYRKVFQELSAAVHEAVSREVGS